MRCYVWFAAAMLLPGATAQQPPAIGRYCTGCHNAKLKTGNLALDPAQAAHPESNPAVWEKVARRLRARQMPPAGAPQPSEAMYAEWIAGIESSLDRASAAKPDPGRTATFRRLTRTEYRNSIRDLLTLDVDVASLLPADEASHGFDNVTTADLPPALLEKYLGAARKIARLAVGIPPKSPGGDTIGLPPDLTQEEHFDKLPIGTRGGLMTRYTFPADATYEFQVRLMRDRNEHVEGLYKPHQVELLLDGERVRLFTVEPPDKDKGEDHSVVDKNLKFRAAVKAGPHWVAAAFPKLPTSLLETERQPYQAHFNMDRHPRVQPAVHSISVLGPYEAKGPGDTPARRRVFVCSPAAPAEEEPCAQRILATLMRRAYRRAVTADDARAPMKFFRDARKNGSFDDGVEMSLRAVLVSPEFLFRVERDPADAAPEAAYRVTPLELATRLSFFLWSSIPDDALLDSAIQGRLRQPAELERQVRRMLADSRSEALVNNFADQWLHLRNLASATPDMRLFPDFDDNLRQSFRRETELLFESVMREDRSVLDLLGAGYTFLDERLAKHYGIPNVYGSRFRKVSLAGNSQRGGLLRHGSILTVTSYATRTSPVIRGKWILENLMGIPPPPPPGKVPALKEKATVGKFLTMRERLAEHRDNPACSGCHQLMDPPGFSLENYDAVGRWRSSEEGVRVDALGGLPGGSTFDGADGLVNALLGRPELFVSTMSEKLLIYGLGRGVEPFDGPAVRRVVSGAKASDYKFSSIILGIASSTPFQMRRAR